MSGASQPIDPLRFAAALESLDLETLHNKAAEIRNQLGHLKSSNDQLLPFAQDGDADCDEAIKENLDVMARMRVRLDLLKAEVQRRGMPWVEDDEGRTNGDVSAGSNRTDGPVASRNTSNSNRGALSDAELARRLQERMQDELVDDEDEGVHL